MKFKKFRCLRCGAIFAADFPYSNCYNCGGKFGREVVPVKKGDDIVPIKWNASRVSEAADMMEQYVKEAAEPLEQARLVAQEARKIPNLPQYIDDFLARFLVEIGRAVGGHQFEPVGHLNTCIANIRERIPQAAIKAEQAKAQTGSQQSLM